MFLGQVEIVKYLLQQQVDLKIQDADGKNCLHRAFENGNYEIGQLIAIAEPKLNEQKDIHGRVPLDYSKN